MEMEEIIKDLEHTIKYFGDSQNDFQRGRVFQCIKILEALRKHDVVERSEQLICKCQCTNSLEYSNCSKKCERIEADTVN